MKIGIDARLIPYKQKDGIAYYSLYLIENLLKIDHDNEYALFYNLFMKGDRNLVINLSEAKNAKNRVFLIPGRILDRLWINARFPSIECFLGKLDIFHTLSFTSSAPYFYIPPQKRGKRILTIHDIFPLQFPQEASVYNIKEYRRGLDSVVKEADAIICVSESEKKDLLSYAGISSAKVFAVHSGIAADFYKCTQAEKINKALEKYNIRGKYILNVSNLDYKKNIVNLIKAFSLFFRKDHNFKLVIAGRRGNAANEVFSTIDKLNLSAEVIYLDYVDKEDLTLLLGAATVFVFPSIYESFGFPNLEAMACEVPVVSSDIDAIKEVVGDAALLVDPNSPQAIAQAMSRVINDDAFRNNLIAKGKERVKFFSWENTAKNTLEVYRKVAGG